MTKSVGIIGAGASGLLSSILCAKAGLKVEIYEQNTKPAKKILASGNGRCNISNANLSVEDYFSEDPNFVQYALENFGFKEFEKFTQKLGLLLTTLEDGRAYPLSNEAKSVAKIFEEYARNHGVIFHNEKKITDIKMFKEKYDAVIVATGSRAASHLGGNSDGEEFALAYGHNIIPAYPSLVQLELSSKIAHKMSGTKIYTEVTLLINAQEEQTQRGDLLFSTYGVSGFAILDLSQMASSALLNSQTVEISINLLPNFTTQKLAQHIAKIAQQVPTFTISNILVGILPGKIVSGVLESLEISPLTKGSDIHTKLTKKIANQMCNWRFKISDTHGFRHAEVSGGGIDTTEIDEKTMMSKKVQNLYFTGEVLDVVGKRGGYNFAWAWASGFLAAQSIKRELL